MSHASDIEAQAAQWFAQVDASEDTGKSAEFNAWLARDPRHRAAYLRLAAAWQRSERLKGLRLRSQEVDLDLLARPSALPWNTLWRRPLVIGIATIATLAVFWQVKLERSSETYKTDVGGLSRVVLRDGSAVTLNTDTELRVHFGDARREVELYRGEAEFNVAHDPNRPFEVRAAGRLLRAVGTSFDVRLDKSQALEVLVTEGRVALVDAPSTGSLTAQTTKAATISAGESVWAGGGTLTVRKVGAAESLRQLAWRRGELSFQGETLREAVEQFNRYNRRKLSIGDSSLQDVQIGGNFQALDLDSFLAALDRSFGVEATQRSGEAIIILRRRAPTSNDGPR